MSLPPASRPPDRNRVNGNNRRPVGPDQLTALLRELDIKPPGTPQFRMVSRWAAKRVWRIDVSGEPWAYVRFLLGTAAQFPNRWRHLRVSTLLNEARVGPRVLGITEASSALEGRPAMIEAALNPITREELEERAAEAISLFARLHSNKPVRDALYEAIAEGDDDGMRPLARQFQETRERWFEAVTPRWLEAGLSQIGDLTAIVGELINDLESRDCCFDHEGRIVPAHGDANHRNFMLNRQGALRLIDFENLTLNNPVTDLGVFLTWYVDPSQHMKMLENYPTDPPEAILERMQVWVPLRYIGIAAHWAARLTRARDASAWEFAVGAVDEWLRAAAEMVAGGAVPHTFDKTLSSVSESLMVEWPPYFLKY